MDDEPREYTTEEVREMFLSKIRVLVDYYSKVQPVASQAHGQSEVNARLEGLAFSILSMLDGETELSGFHVIPCPHAEDREFCESEGENWFPPVRHADQWVNDIAGSLHERLRKTGDPT